MSRRSSGVYSLFNSFSNLLGKRKHKNVAKRRRALRRSIVEMLEDRKMFALNILNVSPPNSATEVPVDTDLVITFDANVLKGQGNIHVIRESTGTLGVAVDVTSSNVQIVGDTVTIDLPEDLELDNFYSVLIDDGAFLDTSTTAFPDTTLLIQDFEYLPLSPFVTESGGDGTDYTLDPPLGFTVDNSALPAGGVPEWQGWSFADKVSWANVDNQSRDAFTLATGTVAVADSDEWDDATHDNGLFESGLISKPIQLSGVSANSVTLEFDSSFRPEANQKGTLSVRFDGGAWDDLLVLDSTQLTDLGPEINQNLSFNINNPNAGTMEFRWLKSDADNDWWWAIDNIRVAGEVVGDAFEGISDPLVWKFATPESPKLTLSIDVASMSENGGVATGTVTRNLAPTDPLVIDLVSNDTTEATVPMQVTIPAGQASVTFQITAVDDLLSDRDQLVTISAANAIYGDSAADIIVVDDEGPKLVSTTPADDSTGVDYQTDFVANFDVDIRKGQGRIYIVDAETDALGFAVDVNDPSVTVSGSTLSIASPGNLFGLHDYYVLIDNGAILDTSSTATAGATLLFESFDLLPLNPAVFEGGGDGTDWTNVPPLNFNVDNSALAGGGVPEWSGWTFADRDFWAQAGGQNRSDFTRASGNVAVADPDEWDDTGSVAGAFNSFLITPEIDLTGVAPGTLSLEFDSSYRPELPQIGNLYVSYDNGPWDFLAFFESDVRNGQVVIDSSSTVGTVVGGATILAPLNNSASASSVRFRFGLENAGNNWWWAVDNLHVKGEIVGLPFPGISDPSVWNFQTAEAPTVTVTTAAPSVSEGAGTLTGTVTRNLSTVGDLVVNLQTSDATAATVPSSVTILDGQSSVDFTITVIDDAIADGTQTVIISAVPPTDYFSVPASLDVLDDDFPQIVSVTPADDSVDVPVETDFVITFDQDVKKGNGFIHILRASDGKVGVSVDVNSADVTISGTTVTINPPVDLGAITDYYVSIDSGAILGLAASVSSGATLLFQDFETLPLTPAQFESGGDGTDFTVIPPTGYSIDNSAMDTTLGAPEWAGWSFADRDFWSQAGGQDRVAFTLGSGTVAVADSDEYDDLGDPPQFNSLFRSVPIQLADVSADSVQLTFDSSFRPEGSQVGFVEVSFDAGANWTRILELTTQDQRNQQIVLDVGNPESADTMEIRFGYSGSNNWWWAIDNIHVTGDVIGLPFPGIERTDVANWNFSTEDGSLIVTIDETSVSENGGVANGTVTRNALLDQELIVTLESSDTTEATVPTTVTIPAGATSASFVITAVNDGINDSDQVVSILATATDFISDPGSLIIATDDFPKIESVTPADDSTLVAIDSNLTITFNQDVKKGNGFVHILRASDGKAGESINVNSTAVTISGAVVTIDPSADLLEGTEYYVAFDDGAFLSLHSTLQLGTTLLMQDFETLPLGAAQFESGGDGTDFTLTPPTDYTVDNSNMDINQGVPEWAGWSFADRDFWAQAGGQDRSAFTLGSGTVAIADSDEYDDLGDPPPFDSLFRSVPIQLADVIADSVQLTFDSSFRPEGSQVGFVEVSFDAGANWTRILELTTQDQRNQQIVLDVENPDSAETMEIRFGYTGSNNWWWAIDNIHVTGDVNALPAPGIANSDATTWSFTTSTPDNVAPFIEGVIASSTQWAADFIDEIDGEGAGAGNGLGIQLTAGTRTLPWNDVDVLYVVFSEDVPNFEPSMVEVLSSTGTVPTTVTYDSATFVATISFGATPLSFSKYRLGVSDLLVDAAGNLLDGDGDGNAGGILNRRFDVVPGDGNGDGRVNGSDLTSFIPAFNRQPGQTGYDAFSDWNADRIVNGSDFFVFVSNFNVNIGDLPDPGDLFGSGALGGGSFAPFNPPSLGSPDDDDDDDDKEDGGPLGML